MGSFLVVAGQPWKGSANLPPYMFLALQILMIAIQDTILLVAIHPLKHLYSMITQGFFHRYPLLQNICIVVTFAGAAQSTAYILYPLVTEFLRDPWPTVSSPLSEQLFLPRNLSHR